MKSRDEEVLESIRMKPDSHYHSFTILEALSALLKKIDKLEEALKVQNETKV